RRIELDGCGTKALGGESERIVAPSFIADNGHFFDMLTFCHHEAHVTPLLVPSPSLETFGDDQRPDFPFPGDRFLRDLDHAFVISLLQQSTNFYLEQFSRSI